MVGALNGAVDRPPDADIGLDGLYLAGIAERLQVAGKVGPAAADADAVAAHGQCAHDMAANEPGPTENGDELGDLEDFGHGWLRSCIATVFIMIFAGKAKGERTGFVPLLPKEKARRDGPAGLRSNVAP
jgi:hypothetical protein